jgi:hypothetical protein
MDKSRKYWRTYVGWANIIHKYKINWNSLKLNFFSHFLLTSQKAHRLIQVFQLRTYIFIYIKISQGVWSPLCDTVIPILDLYQRGRKIWSYKDLYMQACSSFVCNSQKLLSQINTHQQINGKTHCYISTHGNTAQSGIITNYCYRSLYVYHSYCAEWKKPNNIYSMVPFI